jgi:hypothetical protein
MQIRVSKDKLKSTINHATEIKTQISNSVHTTEKYEKSTNVVYASSGLVLVLFRKLKIPKRQPI